MAEGKPKTWTVDLYVADESGQAVYNPEVGRSLQFAAEALEFIGGAITVASVRQPREDGSFETTGLVFAHKGYVPAAAKRKPPTEPEHPPDTWEKAEPPEMREQDEARVAAELEAEQPVEELPGANEPAVVG